MDFRIWALLSAVFAGVTAVLAKKGVENVPSNFAVAIRVLVVVAFAWVIAYATKEVQWEKVDRRAWGFLIASGCATGLSWLCYFKALSLGPVSQIAPIDKLSFVLAMVLGVYFLKERMSWHTMGGAALVVAGIVLVLSAPAAGDGVTR